MKTGATKVGLPKPGVQERTRQGSLSHTSSSTISSAMKTSRSSNTLASDQRLSRVSHSHVSHHNEKFNTKWSWHVSAALTAGAWISFSWNEPTATMRWRSRCWALLPPALAWRRLWPLEPFQTLLRAALALCLVGDLPPEKHSQSSVTNWLLEHESCDHLTLELLFTSE